MNMLKNLLHFIVLIILLILSSVSYSSNLGFPSISGMAEAARSLGELLARGISFDAKSAGTFLSVLNELEISQVATDEAVKVSLSTLSNGAKTASEHLDQLEQLMEKLNRSMDDAILATETDRGPSLSELANGQLRCRTIVELRELNTEFGEGVETLQKLSQILPQVRQRAEFLTNFESELERVLIDLQQNPALVGAIYGLLETNLFFDPWLKAYENARRASDLASDVSVAENKVARLLPALTTKRANFDANMQSLIEPLAGDYCNTETDRADFANYENHVIEDAPTLRKRPNRKEDCLDFDAEWSKVVLAVKNDNTEQVWQSRDMATSWVRFHEIMTGIEQRLMARQKQAVDYCYSLVPKEDTYSATNGVDLGDIEKEFLEDKMDSKNKGRDGGLLAAATRAGASYDDQRRKSSKAAMEIIGSNAAGVHLDKDCNFDPNEFRRYLKSPSMRAAPVESLDQVIANGKGMGYSISQMSSLNHAQVAECQRAINERRRAGSTQDMDVLEDCVFTNNFYARALECRQQLARNQGGY